MYGFKQQGNPFKGDNAGDFRYKVPKTPEELAKEEKQFQQDKKDGKDPFPIKPFHIRNSVFVTNCLNINIRR